MSAAFALVTTVCPACGMPMRMRADVTVDGDERVLDTEIIDRGILLHLRLSCSKVARYTPVHDVRDAESVVLDEDVDP